MATQRPLPDLLAQKSINLMASATSRDDAIRQAGEALVAVGAIRADYIDEMIERENSVSTYVGEGVAIPHGTLSGTSAVSSDAISLLRFPAGVDWDGHDVRVVIGIAARGNGHISLLSQLATILLEPETAEAMRNATTMDEIYTLLSADNCDRRGPV